MKLPAGLIYRAHRPVYWSPTSRTALAEAELEYNDTHFGRSAYVRFDLETGPALRERIKGSGAEGAISRANGITALIWTTTPWTLPSNMALNINPEIEYSLVRPEAGELKDEVILVATQRMAAISKLKIGIASAGGADRPRVGPLDELVRFEGESEVLKTTRMTKERLTIPFVGSALLDSTYIHPFLPVDAKPRPILPASYVTADSGTGVVHSAPGHGQDDYTTWKEYCKNNADAAAEEIASPLDDEGRYTAKILQLAGPARGNALLDQYVLRGGTRIIVEMLHGEGRLFCDQPIQHRYPYDWRTKQPIVVRTTSQWFANLSPIKDAALAALTKVKFVPESGRTRLEALVRGRSEWCISRQRAWGVPIPVLYDADSGEALMSEENMRHVEGILAEKGTDYWWQGPAEEFVAPSQQREGRSWVKGTDTVDVWFDSGSSWNTLPGAESAFEDPCRVQTPTNPVADVYFEGTDQHRGWFQSSLLTYIASSKDPSAASAPYKVVATHGFTVDRKGQKMSKSLGNVKTPRFFLFGGAKNVDVAYGTDALRMWAARGNYTGDVTVSSLVVKHASQALRSLRNTCRYLLASLPKDRSEIPPLQDGHMTLIERFVLDELYRLETACRKAYSEIDSRTVLRLATEFANTTLSSLFFEMSKDTLYADSKDSKLRQSTIAVMDQVLRTFTTILSPIVPHLAEEIYHFYLGAQADPSIPQEDQGSGPPETTPSVFQIGWQRVPEQYLDPQANGEFSQLGALRSAVLTVMEQARQQKLFRTTLELDVDITLGAGDWTSSVDAQPVAARSNAAPGDRAPDETGDYTAKESDESPDDHSEISAAATPTPKGEQAHFRRQPLAPVLQKHAAILTRVLSVSHVRLLDTDGTVVYDSDDSAEGGGSSSSSTERAPPNSEWKSDAAAHSTNGQHADCTFRLAPSRAHKCPRCWTFRRAPQKTLCARCETVVDVNGWHAHSEPQARL